MPISLSKVVGPAGTNHDLLTVPYGEKGVTFAFECFGRRIAVSLGDATLLDRVLSVMPPAWSAIGPAEQDTHIRVDSLVETDARVTEARYAIDKDGQRSGTAAGVEGLIAHLDSMLEHDVAEFAEPCLFMHAGVVSWNGQVIVLPGASHAGKSTLVAALVEAGAMYFSDEFAVLTPAGEVLPFPRRMSLRDGPFGPARRVDLCAEKSAVATRSGPLPIGLVAMLEYRDRGEVPPQPLLPGSAIMALSQHIVPFRRRPAEALMTLNIIAHRAPVLRGERGEARTVVRLLLERCGSRQMSGPVSARAQMTSLRLIGQGE